MSVPACIVIDDPLLRPRYGFLNFYKLLDWLKAEDLAATIAFIPFNYRRSGPRIAKLLRDNPDRLSICVHGCDHTRGEFASTDSAYLDGICALAKERMTTHERLYGLPWDNLIVFPQGEFSNEAMKALKAAGFVAAVNTLDDTCHYDLSGRYVMDFGFPLVTRRNPERTDDFIQDAEFRRPIIITQHHWDFAHGFDYLTKFTRELKAKIPDLKWMPLGRIACEIGLVPSSRCHSDPIRHPPQQKLKIALRRYLCEFRDNYVQPLRLRLNLSRVHTASSDQRRD
jgi:hypothetical protein